MNIQFQATSKLHQIKELFPTKKALQYSYDWAEDLVVTEIDVDDKDYILRDIPEELKSSISWIAYEGSHAYGDDEVANAMRNLVSNLLPAILAYGIRMKKDN